MSTSLNSSFTASWRTHGTPENIQHTDQPGVYEMVSTDEGQATVSEAFAMTSAPVLALADEALDQSLETQVEGQTAPVAVMPDESIEAPFQDQTSERSAQTSIPVGWTFNGDIISSDSVELSCVLNGNLTSENDLADVTLHQPCKSKGNVHGKRIAVHGNHSGSIDAAGGRISIESTSHINGDVTYSFIQMNGGAHTMQLKYVDA